MTDDAIFIMYDYFGPVRMQWDHRVIDIANSLMRRIPLSLREKLPEVQRTGIYEFLRCDPSEGVSGGNVLEIAKSIFEVVEEINMGSTLGHPMFAYNASLFDMNNVGDRSIAEIVIEFESILVEEGIIQSDIKLVICRARADVSLFYKQ
ncbi:hypothetical protein [Pararhodospirillum photometricum]|uniref:hypothetical protein n=1 Tax=Pararhodospirillum photometricum TaxID=1084 RepID=UPI0012FEE428|nr:hypothetical protein [Pararhodospirillum photometricum]